MHVPIDGHAFLEAVRPALERQDARSLVQCVASRWGVADVRKFLIHPRVEVRRVAAVTLGLVGSLKDMPVLMQALYDPDVQVNQMVENALWSIWFRACTPKAARSFREGLAALSAESYEQAIPCFEQAFAADPQFAEAYNQCAIAHYFLGQWQACIDDCDRTTALIPQHFGAILGKGHCYAQMGMIDEAVNCYADALRINPHMPAISSAMSQIRGRRKQRVTKPR